MYVISAVFLCLFFPLSFAFPPLICTTRPGAVLTAAAACQHLVDCRFEFGAGAAALPPAGWDVLLTTQTGLISANASAVASNDVRFLSYPSSVMTTALPLLAYDPTSVDAVDCDTLAVAVATDPTLVPASVWFALTALVVHQTHASEDQACADLNEIPVLDNTTEPATVQFLCAPGKMCNMGNAWIYDLVAAVAIIVLVFVVVEFIFGAIISTVAVRKFDKATKKRATNAGRSNEGTDFSVLF